MRIGDPSMIGLAVAFDTIHIREYEREISDNPSCSSGAPIGIGWAFNPKEKVISVDEYEARRGRRRVNNELMMPRGLREKILMKEWGFPRQEVAAAVRANIKQKNQRRRTVVNLGRTTKFEEIAESAGRKLKRKLLGLKKDSEQYEIWKREVAKASTLMAEETANAINNGERAAAAAQLDACSSVSDGDLENESSAGTFITSSSEPRVHPENGRFYTLWEKEAARASTEAAMENASAEAAFETLSRFSMSEAGSVAHSASSSQSSTSWRDANVIEAECSAVVLQDDDDMAGTASMPVATQVDPPPQQRRDSMTYPDDFSTLIHDQVICTVHNTSIEEQKRIIQEFAAAQAAMTPQKSALSHKHQMDEKYVKDQKSASTPYDSSQMQRVPVARDSSMDYKPRRERTKKGDSPSTTSQQKAVRRRTIEEMEGEYWN